VDQDSLGAKVNGLEKCRSGSLAKQLRDGSRAGILLNRGSVEAEISANWEDLGYPAGECFGSRFVAAQRLGKVHGEVFPRP